jgi:hypothetical protein
MAGVGLRAGPRLRWSTRLRLVPGSHHQGPRPAALDPRPGLRRGRLGRRIVGGLPSPDVSPERPSLRGLGGSAARAGRQGRPRGPDVHVSNVTSRSALDELHVDVAPPAREAVAQGSPTACRWFGPSRSRRPRVPRRTAGGGACPVGAVRPGRAPPSSSERLGGIRDRSPDDPRSPGAGCGARSTERGGLAAESEFRRWVQA